ncbi:MAG TPA: thiamine pyrophosphate-dependent enzyme [Candidatus Ozemobacteraceae bacterium]|nr:thiamine pyrophosphate-dependent enzyme [Candidatus Ozemobacteraceae bacterium]
MKKLGELLLASNPAPEITMGNYALVRAMIESGTRVVTSYPGSPTPEIAEAIASLPKEANPLYFEFSTNEKVALEVAFGAAVNGHTSCVFFKSVGLNVAADSFVQLSMMEIIGGMVIILGDDPGANSSQNEQDNRHYARLSYTPLFEPASPTEAYEMFKEATRISREKRMPVILRLTTHVCHAKEKIAFGPYQPITCDDTPRFDPKNGPYWPITAAVFPLKRKALKRLQELATYAESCRFTRVVDHRNPQRGIITAGLPYYSLLDSLEQAALKPDLLILGLVHPLPRRRIVEFLRSHVEVKILEELDDFLEAQIKAIAYEEKLSTRILGKLDPDEWLGEYTPERVDEILRRCWADLLPAAPPKAERPALAPVRPPQLCPGCGHRTAFHAVKKALPPETITVADIGCHSLGFLEPYEMGQVLLCMGHSSGTAAGMSLFNRTRPVVAFIGDSTFFHAGLPAQINALFNRHNFTLIVMENGTTAMTGHQNHPASGGNFREAVEAIPIRRVLEALGVKSIRECDTYQEGKLIEMVKLAIAEPGFKVVIARHPCMLKFTRETRRKGRSLQPPVRVSETCDLKKACIADFACPTYQFGSDGKVFVQTDLCIGDQSCRQNCPTQAIVPSTTTEKPQ